LRRQEDVGTWEWERRQAEFATIYVRYPRLNYTEDLIRQAQSLGVELIACSMSMDVMGIKKEELIDGVTLAGAAAMLANAEESDMSLFI
jgi:peroxiredoxin family protein